MRNKTRPANDIHKGAILLIAKSAFAASPHQAMQRLADLAASSRPDAIVRFAFTEQGTPSLHEALNPLLDEDVDEIVIVPLVLPIEPSFHIWLKKSLTRWRSLDERPWPALSVARDIASSALMGQLLNDLLETADQLPNPTSRPPSPEGSLVPAQKRRVLVCEGGACNSAGADAIWGHLRNQQERRKLRVTGDGTMTAKSTCLGPCNLAPVLQVFPEGTYYGGVTEEAVDRIITEHLLAGQVVEDFAYHPTGRKQRLRQPPLKNRGDEIASKPTRDRAKKSQIEQSIPRTFLHLGDVTVMERVAATTASAMADHWNSRAWKFDGAASHRRDADAWRTVFKAALGEAPLDVVDLGCGTGACALLAGALGHRVTGVDGSAEMLSHAKTAATEADLSIKFINATMDEAALPAASADIVTLRNVLWTLENPSAALALARMLLRPGGKLLVSDGLWFRHRVNNSRDIFGAHLPFYNGLTEDEARGLLAGAGFGGVESWRHLMPGNPYGAAYDDAEMPIAFFILTAIAPE